MSHSTDNLQLFQNAVQGIYRLFRVARIHDVNNDAVDDSIAAALDGLTRLTDGTNGVLLLFARDTVLVNGQLLPMPPDVWETAMALQKFLAASGVNSLWLGIQTDRHALRTLLRFFRQGSGTADPRTEPVVPDARGYLATGIRVRRVADSLVVGIESPELSESERALLTYALAVRGVRTLSEEFRSAPAGFSSYFKRVAWQLSRLPVSQLRHLIDVGTIDREDTPTRVVQASLVASLMARLLDADDRDVSSILLASLQLDASDARDHLSVSTGGKDAAIDAVVLQMFLNGLRGDSARRAIIAFETRRLMDPRRRRIHRWGVPASMDAYILATARLFTDTFSRAAAREADAPVDAALRALRVKAIEPGWIASVELLTLALGTPGAGAAVVFANGDSGVVLRSGLSPGTASCLVVHVMASPNPNHVGRVINLSDRTDALQWGTPARCDRPPAWEYPPPEDITEAHLAWVDWIATLRDKTGPTLTRVQVSSTEADAAPPSVGDSPLDDARPSLRDEEHEQTFEAFASAAAHAPGDPVPEESQPSTTSSPVPSPSDDDADTQPIEDQSTSAVDPGNDSADIELLTGRVRRTAAPDAGSDWLRSDSPSVSDSASHSASTKPTLPAAGVNRQRRRNATGANRRVTGSGGYVIVGSSPEAPRSPDPSAPSGDDE